MEETTLLTLSYSEAETFKLLIKGSQLCKVDFLETIHLSLPQIHRAEGVKVHSYYAAIALCCRTAPSCTEISMLLHCGVA